VAGELHRRVLGDVRCLMGRARVHQITNVTCAIRALPVLNRVLIEVPRQICVDVASGTLLDGKPSFRTRFNAIRFALETRSS
jgi:hypothetical protein